MKTCGLTRILWIGLIIVLVPSSPAFAASNCTGVPSFPEQDKVCSRLTSEKSCLSRFASESELISKTCRWVTQTGAVTREIQDTYTQYGTTLLSDITWPRGAKSFAVKLTLPGSARGKWSGYLSLQSGPQNVSAAAKYLDPKKSFSFSGCQTGTKCELKQTVPKNAFPSATFRKSGVIFTGLLTDKIFINQFNAQGHLDDTYPLKLRVETTMTTAGKPASTPALSDLVEFGPTSYFMDSIYKPDDNHYSVVTYKSYEISNVKQASWKVRVGASLASSRKRTKLTSMLMTEGAYNQYFDECKTTCKPPTSLAIKGTVCTGLACSKRAKSLSTSQKYRLLVSYPTITSLSSAGAYSTSPMTSTFNKQKVKTEIFGRGWKMP